MAENEGEISKETLEKLYCYCFYAKTKTFNSELIVALLEYTYDNPNLPVDYIYDCMVRHPDSNILAFYRLLLLKVGFWKEEMQASSRLYIRKDVFIMIRCIAEFAIDEKNGVDQETIKEAQETIALLDLVKSESVYGHITFDRIEFMELIRRYLKRIAEKPGSSRECYMEYASEIERLYK